LTSEAVRRREEAFDMAETRGITRRDLFRFAAASGVTAAVGLNLGEGGPRAAVADTSTPDGALQALLEGNARWVSHNVTALTEDLNLIDSGTTESHRPFAALLSCADARVSPEFIFDQVMGNLFITRVAGNIATPEIIASLEYAALPIADGGLGVRLIMVLGHGNCGAVSATNSRAPIPGTQISALYAPLRTAVTLGNNGIGGGSVDAKSRLNAQVQAILIQDSSPLVAKQIRAGALKVVAAYYNLVPIPPGPPPGAPPNGTVTILPIPPLGPPPA
jgi:carbonic anhydrase